VLAITKSDMLDDELIEMLEPNLPEGIPYVFISSITGQGIQQLKDILWTELNSESNKLGGASVETIVHRAKDVLKLQQELKDMGEDEDFEFEYEDDADDDFEYEYEEEDWDDEEVEE
jgi:GTP-binding protein